MTIKVDLGDFTKQMANAKDLQKKIIKPAFDFFVEHTPIKTGNARRNTQLSSNQISTSYPYADKLDAGSSKQAPNGMTAPTINEINRLVSDYINKIGK